MQQQQGLAVALGGLALGVPTGLFCAWTLSQKYEKELRRIEKTRVPRELYHEETHKREWFHAKSMVQQYALDLYFIIQNSEPGGAEKAWMVGLWTCYLYKLLIEGPNGNNVLDYVRNHKDIKKLLYDTSTRVQRNTDTTARDAPEINGEVLMGKIRDFNISLCNHEKDTAPAEVLPALVALLEYSLQCFQHFFLTQSPPMTEQAFFDKFIQGSWYTPYIYHAWKNYYDPTAPLQAI